MSDTPRTEAELKSITGMCLSQGMHESCLLDFARRLERELQQCALDRITAYAQADEQHAYAGLLETALFNIIASEQHGWPAQYPTRNLYIRAQADAALAKNPTSTGGSECTTADRQPSPSGGGELPPTNPFPLTEKKGKADPREAAIAHLRGVLAMIGQYTGEGPPTTPWQDIVRDMVIAARAAVSLYDSPLFAANYACEERSDETAGMAALLEISEKLNRDASTEQKT